MRKEKRPFEHKSYEFYLKECLALRLQNKPRVKTLLRLAKAGMFRRRDEEELQQFLENRKSVLLEAGLVVPPPSAAEVMTGHYIVGETIDPDGPSPIGISFSPPRPNVIYGTSGSGKSRLTGLIVEQIRNDIPVFIFDPRGDFEFVQRLHPDDTLVIEATRFPFNPFAPDGVPFETNARGVVSVLAECLTLYHRGQTVLLDAITEIWKSDVVPTLNRIISFLETNSTRYARNREALGSVLDRLQGLKETFGEAWNVEQGVRLKNLYRFKTVVFRMAGIERVDARVAFTVVMLRRIFAELRERGERPDDPQICVVIEEAHYVLDRKLESSSYSVGIITELSHLMRSVGLLAIFITQDPTSVNPSLLNDSGNIFSFGLREGKAEMSVVRSLGLPDEAAKQIASLPDRQCYCRLNRGEFREPFLMRTANYNVDTTPLTPAEFAAHQEQVKDFLAFAPADPPDHREQVEDEEITRVETLRDDAWYFSQKPEFRFFLYAAGLFGHEGKTRVYKKASLTPTTGLKYVDRAIDEGLLGSHEIALPGRSGNAEILFLTKAARRLLRFPSPPGVGSPKHTALQRAYHHFLLKEGFDIKLEKTLGDGSRIDLIHRWEVKKEKTHWNALEIELSTPGVPNAKRALAADPPPTAVFLIVPLDRFGSMTARAASEFSGEERERVHVVTTWEFVRTYVKWWKAKDK